jgi:hypothetical protein
MTIREIPREALFGRRPLEDLPNRRQRRAISAYVRSAEFARTYFLLLNTGKDLASLLLGGGALPGADTAIQGNATAVAATSLTNTGAAWTSDRYKGHIIFAGPNASGTGSKAWGVILTNSATVATIDRWYNPDTPGSQTAATTPNATASYAIGMSGFGAPWISLTENAGAPAAGDTQLTGELVVGTSAGLERVMATYAHTGGTATFTLTKAYTLTGGTSRTIQKAMFSNSAVDSANQLALFETAVPSPPVLVTNDQLTITETVTLS